MTSAKSDIMGIRMNVDLRYSWWYGDIVQEPTHHWYRELESDLVNVEK